MQKLRPVMFAVIGILVVVLLATSFLPGGGKGKATPTPTLTSVVVAKHDIPPFTILKQEDVRTISRPIDESDDTFGGLHQVTGLLTTSEVRAGNIIKRSDVLDPPANWADKDMLIFSFYVSTDKIVGGQLRPGHHIDLLVTKPESEEQTAQSLWLARNIWVVGVQQASGEDITRPTVAVYATPGVEATKPPSADIFGTGGGTTNGAGGSTLRGRQGTANLVVVLAPRSISHLIGDYLGARLYTAWIYIRPGQEGAVAGRIDGQVFVENLATDKALGIMEKAETGLDNVTVRLLDDTGAEKVSVKTLSGGMFHFDELKPGTYVVEVITPDGYVSTTPTRLEIEIAEGENQHVVFGLGKPVTPTSEPQAKVVAKEATSVPATPIPPSGECAVAMSDKADGSTTTQAFQMGTTQVWVKVDLGKCTAGTGYTVVVRFPGAGTRDREVQTGTCDGKSSPLVIAVQRDTAQSPFAPGDYETLVQVGPQKVVCAQQSWKVLGAAEVTDKNTPAVTPTSGTPVADKITKNGISEERER